MPTLDPLGGLQPDARQPFGGGFLEALSLKLQAP